MPSDPGSMPVDGAKGSKSSTCSKCGMSVLIFLEVHILTTTYQKAFMLGPRVPYRVGSHCITLDPWVLARLVVEAKN